MAATIMTATAAVLTSVAITIGTTAAFFAVLGRSAKKRIKSL